ncbi:hypothetical protein AM588_10003997 [Phytophthora nicotianae]|uniref:Cation efflux protein cytoplasmic domain-containing protein n=1 Tax=Phytophthora nicotianae TaxID=4792 RepID=A0A0W8D9V8_PHYNI|nr:hypothetical protein AM588_10003997 [Phytophthora nicotianae]
MWRVRSGNSVFASLTPRSACHRSPGAKSVSPARQLRRQRLDFRLSKQLAAFSSEPIGRSNRVQDEVEEAKASLIPRFSQGDEAMKITRVGYGKYEAVGSLSVGAILVLCGLGIGADGFQALQEILNGAGATSLPEFNLPFLSEIDRSTQWAFAAGAAGVSIAAKEALYHATVKIVAGMAVAAMIVKTGGEICLDSVQELTDNTVEAEVLETLEEVEVPDVSEVLVHIDVQFDQFSCSAFSEGEVNKKNFRPYREIKNDISYALATIPEITGTTHINTHWLPHIGGRHTAVDVAIVVQPDLKVGAAHGVAKKARKAIEAIPYIVEADIHLELQDEDGEQG